MTKQTNWSLAWLQKRSEVATTRVEQRLGAFTNELARGFKLDPNRPIQAFMYSRRRTRR
jgi:hypothetical protein